MKTLNNVSIMNNVFIYTIAVHCIVLSTVSLNGVSYYTNSVMRKTLKDDNIYLTHCTARDLHAHKLVRCDTHTNAQDVTSAQTAHIYNSQASSLLATYAYIKHSSISNVHITQWHKRATKTPIEIWNSNIETIHIDNTIYPHIEIVYMYPEQSTTISCEKSGAIITTNAPEYITCNNNREHIQKQDPETYISPSQQAYLRRAHSSFNLLPLFYNQPPPDDKQYHDT